MLERVGVGCLGAALMACNASATPPPVGMDEPADAHVGAPQGDASLSTPTSDAGSSALPDAEVDGAFEPDGAPCPAVTPPAQPQVLTGEVAQVTAECGSADGGAPPLVGPVPPSTVISLSIGLPDRNTSQLNIYLQNVSDPTSPMYRMYLTPAQYTAMFGPTECDYQAVVDWAESEGLTIVNTYSDRELVDVSATASVLDAVLHVTFNEYLRQDGTQFYAPNQDPSIDLSVPLLSIDGLDNCSIPEPG
ncbi:MAG: protease pro-enzyme activation domain-containing protein [Polyangiaceae bacterium]